MERLYTEVAMPCPLFEPTERSASPEHPGARLPLIDEYDGKCRAGNAPFAVPGNLRHRCCNHGYDLGACPHFPLTDPRSCRRFDVRRDTPDELQLLSIEERSHAPAAWRTLSYRLEAGDLYPEPTDPCERAQALAFCRSYLRRFRS